MKSLIVVPTYNEVENLRPLVGDILKSVPDSVDVLIVDDGSPDGTGALADLLAHEHVGRVHVLHREKKMGLGTAYVAGFGWGMKRPEYVNLIEMDADFSHHPKYLPRMLEVLSRADVAIGSRYVHGGGTKNWGIGRKILSKGGSIYSRTILGAPINDFTGGFNGWRRNVLEAVDYPTLRSDGYSFQIELKYRAFLKKFRIEEFPILFEDRKIGTSKMNKRIVFEALKRVWQFRGARNQFLKA
ncbi:MAG: polyprenol monophosphomannose synthase [Proteobacteria bacterium]|nr:MAG: polyprenol monophosphomannose synthase [Pseudomonadota bacterium]